MASSHNIMVALTKTTQKWSTCSERPVPCSSFLCLQILYLIALFASTVLNVSEARPFRGAKVNITVEVEAGHFLRYSRKCFRDSSLCANRLRFTAGAGPRCMSKIVCCPISEKAETIPQFVAMRARDESASDSVFGEYRSCDCRPVEYTFAYLQKMNATGWWSIRRASVAIAFSCNWERKECRKFMC